jgi:hypothetical protein
MGRYYQNLDAPHFDYDLWRVSGLPGEFRGPAVDPDRPFIAFVGAAQTFGRFCQHPFPTLVGQALRLQSLNLGVGGAGPRLFDAPAFIDWMNRASLVVIQVMAARSEGNSYFDNNATGTSRGVRLSDGKDMRFEEFLADLEAHGDTETRDRAIRESRENLVKRYITLLRKIAKPKVLLWLSVRRPNEAGDSSIYPHFVDQAAVNAIRHFADAYVECASDKGLPQRLWEAAVPIDGAWVKDGHLTNTYYPSPEMHLETANLLVSACRPFVGQRGDRTRLHIWNSLWL